jgi:hypothetical protein
MKLLRTINWIGAAALLAATSVTAHADTLDLKKMKTADIVKLMTPMKGSTPAQWRVSWTGDTSTEATVSWSTGELGKKNVLHYGTKPHGKDVSKYENHLEVTKSAVYSMKERDAQKHGKAFYHHAELTGLKPGTKYYFVMESDGELSRQLYFITSPKSGTFKLLTGGDSRTGVISRCKMNLRMADLFEKNPDVLALVHGGDFVASGPSWGQWRTWLSNNELTTLKDGRVLPIIPTRGNHDGGPLIFEIFNWEKKREKPHHWQTTQVTDDVHIVTLDTNVSANGPQEEWLKQQLESLRPKSRWLLTNYHRPLFPAVKTPADQTAVFLPLFEKYNVDLGLESDGHAIKRTVPIRDGKKDPTGVVYVGEGGLGVGQRSPKRDLWYFDGGFVGKGHHVMLLEFGPKELKVQTVSMSGEVLDEGVISVRKEYAK